MSPTTNALASTPNLPAAGRKLWLYTNYDCNLSCSYCVAYSTPRAPRRALGLETVQQAVDEAAELGFDEVFLTGGEPLILPDIYAMIAYAAARLPVTVLTNAMLVKGTRLEKLRAVQHPNLRIQVSLDGANAHQHEAYRGAGSWAPTIAGILRLLEAGFHVRLSTTETPANQDFLSDICTFHLALGIPEENHFIRPLAKRGFATEGIHVGKATLAPELTINVDGVYWHPLSTDADMQVSAQIFPLADAVQAICAQIETQTPAQTFT